MSPSSIRDPRFPVEFAASQFDVGHRVLRTVRRQVQQHDSRRTSRQMNHVLGQGIDPNRVHASDIDRFGQFAGRIHHPHERLDRVVDIEKTAGLHPVAPGSICSLPKARSADESGDHASVPERHARSVDVEPSRDTGTDPVLMMIGGKNRLRRPAFPPRRRFARRPG